ncbi:MAG: 3-hydroxyacyl-CoA dehydrogenase/enoyl-CoA hydratase family protein [Planctomycetes bacterium]|nr:3-hydroxyacyl-CoA dehydrogenase/enoyl-CoA hydratase family protein [Planctomycetota bacterium]
MPFTFSGKTLRKVGVIGSGQIGPDIALHFTKVLAEHGTPVVVVDISAEALARGRAKLEKKVQKGVESKAFAPDEAARMLEAVSFTSDYAALAGADLVVEAATEDERIKGKIFAQLEAACSKDALLLSNSSHLEPERIFAGIADRSRTAVVHYFFPAERNYVVEVVPGKDTADATARWLLGFYEAIGKVPVRIGSRYGYAIDPIFEGLLQTSCWLVENGHATTKEVDAVAKKILGLGVGPFTAHNLTGGNPITAEGLEQLHERVHPWFQPPPSLLEKVAAKQDWEVPGRGEQVDVAPERAARIADALLGTYYGLVCEVLDSGITNVADYDLALEMSLDIQAPFQAMDRLGTDRALALVRKVAEEQPGFPVARCLVEKGEAKAPWDVPFITRDDRDGVAVLTIRRPKVLNALNAEVFAQLQRHAEAIAADASVVGAVITGFGAKAFVSGADVGFLARIETPEQGDRTCLDSQRPLNTIQALKKPVVCAMNGLAFGGGNELAMACHARLCVKGLKVLAAQPEPNLGIIPGAGGTQRLPRLIGVEQAARLLRTGKPISSADAVKLGLVREEVERDALVAAAVDLVRRAAKGEVALTPLPTGPLPDVPATLPDVDLGHLSRAVDQVLSRAILEGARLPLDEGLRLEARLFGECVKLKDMRIGITTFLEQGPRARAPFVHG